jgi:hypothetical protein
MIGEQLGSDSGKVTGMRILPGEGGRFVKMEVSFQHAGTLLGVEMSNAGTYVAYERIPGQIYGEGQGIIMTADGDGIIWNAFGVGEPAGSGMGIRWRACLSFQASSQKMARLNTVLGMVEYETDAEGNGKSTVTEWK